jgi:hypothetical protein
MCLTYQKSGATLGTIAGNDNEVKFHEIKIQRKDRGSFDRNSVDQNCVLSVDRNFHNQLTEIFETFT